MCICKRQVLGVTYQRWQADTGVQQAVAPFEQHGFVDVGVHDLTACPNLGCKRQGQITRTAGNVQHLLACFHISHQNGVGLPGPVHARRHQIIHDVVSGRHRIKHASHTTCLVLLIDRLKTEMGTRHKVNVRGQNPNWQ